jgi:uncharacterized protein (DUF4213/DUF364 family)
MGDGLILQRLKEALSAIVADHQLGGESVLVTVEPLSAAQAIGRPQRQDFPLLEGREVMIEAEFRGSFGQAFTDHLRGFEGSLDDVQRLLLDRSDNRAIFVSTLNAVACHLGIATGTRHCRDEDPERCGAEIASHLFRDFGKMRIGLLGFQPAMVAHLAERFGAANVRCTDLNPANIGSCKSGVGVEDGRTDTGNVVAWSDVLLVTGSAIVNGTLEDIYQAATCGEKALVIFGVTGAAAAALLGLKRVCPFAR